MTTVDLPRSGIEARVRAPAGTAWWIAALTAAAAAVRFSTLGVQSFWKDEAVTVVRILHPSLFDTLSKVPHSEATPPLYYVLAWLWTRVFGTGEVGIRSLSALVGTATIPVAYLIAERLVSRRAAIATAALVAFNPYLVWYSQEGRAYALLAFLSALSLLLFLVARERPTARNLGTWAIVSALALATHYFAAFAVGAEAAWLAWSLRRRAVMPIAFVGAVAAALVPLAIHQERGGHDSWIHALTLSSRVVNSAKFFLGGTVSTPPPLPTLAAGALVLVALWLLTIGPDERRRVVPAAAIAAAAIGAPLVLSLLGLDYYFHRNVIGGAVALLVVLGAGLGHRVGPLVAAALCAVWLAAVVATDTDARYQRADWRSVAHAIGRANGPRALVTPSLGDEPLEHYLGGLTLTHDGARVAEVDAVGWAVAGHGTRPPPPGFAIVKRWRVGAFTVIRYRAPAPRALGHAALAAVHVGIEHPGVLIAAAAGHSS